MTLRELQQQAEKQIALTGSEDAAVALTIPGRWRKKNKRRIWPGGPIGTIVSEEHGGRLVVLVNAKTLLDAISAPTDNKPIPTGEE